MNSYFECDDSQVTLDHIEKVKSWYKDMDTLWMHIVLKRRASIRFLNELVKKNKEGRKVELIQNYKRLSLYTRYLLNINSNRFYTTLIVDEKLTRKWKKRIDGLNGLIRIIDTTNDCPNEDYYKSNRRIIHKSKIIDQFEEADILSMVLGTMSTYQCKYSSCLGQNIYISSKGSVSFCHKFQMPVIYSHLCLQYHL